MPLTDDQKKKVLQRFFEERERQGIRNLAATKPEIRAMADAIVAKLEAAEAGGKAIDPAGEVATVRAEVEKLEGGKDSCDKLAAATWGPHTKDGEGKPVLAEAVGEDLLAILGSVVDQVRKEG